MISQQFRVKNPKFLLLFTKKSKYEISSVVLPSLQPFLVQFISPSLKILHVGSLNAHIKVQKPKCWVTVCLHVLVWWLQQLLHDFVGQRGRQLKTITWTFFCCEAFINQGLNVTKHHLWCWVRRPLNLDVLCGSICFSTISVAFKLTNYPLLQKHWTFGERLKGIRED